MRTPARGNFSRALLNHLVTHTLRMHRRAQVAHRVAISMHLKLLTVSTGLLNRTGHTRTMSRTRISHLNTTPLINNSINRLGTGRFHHHNFIRIRIITRNIRRTFILNRIHRSSRFGLQVIDHRRFMTFQHSRHLAGPPAFNNSGQSILRIQVTKQRAPNNHRNLVVQDIRTLHTHISLLERTINMNTF